MSSHKDYSAERGASAASLSRPSTGAAEENPSAEKMKRAAAKELIEKYYYQLTEGCGNPECPNQDCASSPVFKHKEISKNDAALKSIELFKNKARLCDAKPSKISKPTDKVLLPEELQEAAATSSVCPAPVASTSEKLISPVKSRPVKSSPASVSGAMDQPFLTEEKMLSVIDTCSSTKNWSLLIRTIGQVYNNPDILKKCFLKDDKSASDPDKDLDCVETAQSGELIRQRRYAMDTDEISLDLESVRRVYSALFSIPNLPFQSALMNAITYLCDSMDISLRHHAKMVESDVDYLNIFIILTEIPNLHSPEFLEVLPVITKTFGLLPLVAQSKLARVWSRYPADTLRSLVETLQQMIIIRVVSHEWHQRRLVNDDMGIVGATKVLRIIYYASLYGGSKDLPSVLEQELFDEEYDSGLNDPFQGALGHEPKDRPTIKEEPLGKSLSVKPLDCREPLLSFEKFINEPLNDKIEMDQDFMYYKQEEKFSFFNYSFILTTTNKSLGMYFDNRIRMLNERRTSLLQSLVHGSPTMPYLRLRIRRDHVIDDALVGLEMAAMDNPQDLKKQLYVEFDGEQGIDEGGVSKEFFQLVIEELFNPDFGMFTYDDETNNYWFNSSSFENDAQFMLIGILLGLAIYNHVILDIHFPMVVYRKLLGKRGTLADMFKSHPTLARSLRHLLDYEGNVEDDFMINFQVGDHDLFGAARCHSLKVGGDKLHVTNDNRQEYVDLYADYLLNKSIEKQFRAFKRGFQMVTDESPLKMLFRPDEIELLICGSEHFDFHALEEATDYDGGFTKSSTAIKFFWEVVHEMSDEEKRKLLQFTTGSDRVPVGGLAKLKLIIARNGPDTDRLPTSHTCFNVLLLPDYSNKDKLRERLLKAITHAKGFGML